MKICSKCHVEKEATLEFYPPRKDSSDGFRQTCRTCTSKQREEYKQSKDDEFWVWSSMLSRCNNENTSDYYNYGGRGIVVCERWNKSYENFIEDVGYKPTKKHTIDRINNNGNYEPDNVKWSTRSEQAINRRRTTNNTSGKIGISWISKKEQWRSLITNKGERIFLGYFEDYEEAVESREEAELKYFGKLVQ